MRQHLCTAPIRLDLLYLDFCIGMIDHASESFPMLISCLGSSDSGGRTSNFKLSLSPIIAGDNGEQPFNRAASSFGLVPSKWQDV